MNIEEITNSIKTKLGDEEAGKIADDLANLLVNDKSQKDTIKEKDDQISKLSKDKDLLVNANANLLLKIPVGKEGEDGFNNSSNKNEDKPFDFRTIFKDGKFKR